MTRIKLLFLSLLMTTMAMAQKEFTLEDLNYGGVNYHRMSPENRFLTWWGDELVRTEAGYCNIVNKKTGEEQLLFTLDDIIPLTQSSEQNRMRHLYNARFPYPGETVVQLINGQETMLVDWKKKQLIAKFDRDKVQASPDDPMLKLTVKLECYEAELRKHQAALLAKRMKAFRMVSRLADSTQRQVLELYFLGERRLRMREVAQIVGYSEQSTYRIYKDALRNLESK